jgi:hypothetical protein
LKEFSYPNAGPVPLIGVFLNGTRKNKERVLDDVFEFTFSFFMTPKVFRFYHRISAEQDHNRKLQHLERTATGQIYPLQWTKKPDNS